jgi:hypothetical protein
MKTIWFKTLQKKVQARKRALGILLTPEQNEALRNPGDNRTPEKRELLARIEARRAMLREPG